jgi:hypothetical protein
MELNENTTCAWEDVCRHQWSQILALPAVGWQPPVRTLNQAKAGPGQAPDTKTNHLRSNLLGDNRPFWRSHSDLF